MKNTVKGIRKDLRRLVKLGQKIEKLPRPSELEMESLSARNRFESTFYSNKLEGNRLSKREAKEAIMF